MSIALDPIGAPLLKAQDPNDPATFMAGCPNSWAGDQGFINWCQALYQHGASSAPPPPTPQLSAISPSSVPPGATGVLVTVQGSGFGDGATLLFNGLSAPTNALGLSARVPDADVASSGNVAVQVRSAAGTLSNSLALSVA